MAKFQIVPGLTFVPRADWKPKRDFPRLGEKIPRSKRTKVFIHHTAHAKRNGSPNIWDHEGQIFDEMRFLQTCRSDLGLDVPYNFVAFLVKDDGLWICEGRGEDRKAAHAKGYNTESIGIAFAGDFESRDIDDGEIAERVPLLSYFLSWLKFSASHFQYGNFEPMSNLGADRPSSRQVWCHKDVSATSCPGRKLIAQLDKINFLQPQAMVS